MKVLEALQFLAKDNKVAAIVYRKPTEDAPTRRHIEPYELQYSQENLIALCWQLQPRCFDTPHSWRCFRIDRIVEVFDIQQTFAPRRAVTIHTGEAEQFVFNEKPVAEPMAKPTPIGGPAPGPVVNQYFEYIESALLDGKADVSEREAAHELARRLSIEQIRAVHAQLYMNILRECLIDAKIDFAEEEYLRKVRRSLKSLGWEP